MSKHTPGPWIAQKDPNAISVDDWCIGIENAPIDYIAVCSERNASLIASAPDLLEALCALVLNHDAGGITRGALIDAKAAFAKATGETK